VYRISLCAVFSIGNAQQGNFVYDLVASGRGLVIYNDVAAAVKQ
jgi:hypothetical protein